MARVLPLKGLRYNPAIVKDLARVVTPPYDVIDRDAQERYYDKHPYNIIRLEYGKTFPDDDETNNVYTRARETFQSWRQNGVLLKEQEEALYLYEQEFTVNGKTFTRRGFFCRTYLQPYSEGEILPHEETLPKAKEDRLKLLRACRANFSPIFGVYRDPDMTIDKVLTGAAAREPDIELRDEESQLHRLWVITDKEAINRVAYVMLQKRIYIADGHHRYETALAYSQEQKRLGLHHSVLMTLVNLHDPGLVILPTHRLIKSPRPVSGETVTREIQDHFDVKKMEVDPARLKSFMGSLHKAGKHAFGLYTGQGDMYLLRLKESVDLNRLMPDNKSDAWCHLDVAVLHHLLLERYFGIGAIERSSDDLVKYTQEEETALGHVDRGEYDFAFFLNPTGVEEMIAVAEAGDKMPQKSTYFYPKLITGLVIHAFDL
ncbi:MAG: DUF1015 domain-containing protein [Peptococcaceae bacterium]|nr:DUF1015 domain-containing protein [Peptococcaceae bacterium]